MSRWGWRRPNPQMPKEWGTAAARWGCLLLGGLLAAAFLVYFFLFRVSGGGF